MSKVAILVLDGWGINPSDTFNAVAQAKTPFTRKLFAEFPHTRLLTSGLAVGLPEGQMGNSEVGHQNLGAGRILYQDFTRIDKSISDGVFGSLPEVRGLLERTRKGSGRLHLMGLVSDGGVHSHQRHALAMAREAKKAGIPEVYLHAFTDGRDTGPRDGQGFLTEVRNTLEKEGLGEIASISGRFYAMDRDQRWERVEKAFLAMVRGQGPRAKDPVELLKERYQADEGDEYITPTVLETKGEGQIRDGDSVFFFNFRADRARQMVRALTDPKFDGFETGSPKLDVVTMTRYDQSLKVPVVFSPDSPQETLPALIAARGGSQLRAAETEKFAHVTFFFSCRREDPFPGEERLLIPSPKVRTYDLKPEMSAPELTQETIARTKDKDFDLVVLNYANADMVGHTGSWEASLTALEALDTCMSQVIPHLIDKGYTVYLTADHGNIEMMQHPETHQPFTEHTTFPVPLLVTDKAKTFREKPGTLADLAPTLMKAAGWDIPEVMTGEDLFSEEG